MKTMWCVWILPNVTLMITGCTYPKEIVPEVLFVLMQLCQSKLCCYVLFREKRISPLKQAVCVKSFSNCTVMNTFTLRCSSWGFCSISEHWSVWPWVEFSGMSTSGKCKIVLSYNPSQKMFFKNLAAVFPLWHRVKTHLKVSDQETAKNSAFINVFTIADDHFIKCIIWLSAAGWDLSSWFLCK